MITGGLWVEWIASDSAQCKGPFKAAELYSSRLGTCCNGAAQNVKALDGTYCREYMGPSDDEKNSYLFGWVLLGVCGCCVVCVCAGCILLCVIKFFGAVVDNVRHRDMRERRMSNIGIDGIVRDANGNVVGAGARRTSNLREQLQQAGIQVRPDGGVALVAMHVEGGFHLDNGYGDLPVAVPVATVLHAEAAGAGGAAVAIAEARVVVPSQLLATRAALAASSSTGATAAAPATGSSTRSASSPPDGARSGVGTARGSHDGPRRESLNPLRNIAGDVQHENTTVIQIGPTTVI